MKFLGRLIRCDTQFNMHGKRLAADKREVVEYVRMHKQQQQQQQHVAVSMFAFNALNGIKFI